jgi:hypothetical protein
MLLRILRSGSSSKASRPPRIFFYIVILRDFLKTRVFQPLFRSEESLCN